MPRTIKIGSKTITLPDYAPARIAIGVLLIIGGMLGFLPVLGFWMIPLGILVLSYDFPRVRLWRQKFWIWWRGGKPSPPPDWKN
jgi:hypothetical protein